MGEGVSYSSMEQQHPLPFTTGRPDVCSVSQEAGDSHCHTGHLLCGLRDTVRSLSKPEAPRTSLTPLSGASKQSSLST